MIERSSIKERAMRMFRANYWPCVGLFAIFAAITGALSGVGSIYSTITDLGKLSEDSEFLKEASAAVTGLSVLFSLMSTAVTIFLLGPLQVSEAKAGLNVYDGNKPDFRHILYGFSEGRYWKSVGVIALMFLFITLAVFAAVIPASIILAIPAIAGGFFEGAEISAAFVVGLVLAVIVVMIPTIILGIGFSQVHFAVAAEGRSGMDAIKRSWELMRGHKWEYFVFALSFLGWELLNVLTLGVLGIFRVNPYVAICYAGYHRELVYSEEPMLMGEPAVDEYGQIRF